MTMIQTTMSDEEREKLTEKYQAASTEEKQKMVAELRGKAIQMGFNKEVEIPGPMFIPYNRLINKEYSNFTWWNHWPVAQIPSDGRSATAPDRVAHTSVSNVWAWENYELTENRQTRIMMHGLTEKHPTELVTLARSWLLAPQLFLRSRGYTNKGYDQAQRAYILECHDPAEKAGLRFEFPASNELPLVNPAFIIKNWGNAGVTLQINRQPIERGKNFRFGHRRTPHGTDLIVWLRLEETKFTQMRISYLEK